MVIGEQAEYEQLVRGLLMRQEEEDCRNRLVSAFNNLTRDVALNADRIGRLKFRDNFDAFIVEVRGLLVVKWESLFQHCAFALVCERDRKYTFFFKDNGHGRLGLDSPSIRDRIRVAWLIFGIFLCVIEWLSEMAAATM